MAESEHPRQHLRFFAQGDWPSHIETQERDALERLTASRDWTLGPPQVSWVPGEFAGELALHSAHPPWSEQLSLETDEAELDQVKALVEVLTWITATLETTITLELDSDYVGEITNDVPDRGVAEILMSEWERGTERRRKG